MAITKQDWIDAGYAQKDIDVKEVEKVLGKQFPSNQKLNWWTLTSWVYETLTGNKLTFPYRGTGFNSQHGGQKVAEVWQD